MKKMISILMVMVGISIAMATYADTPYIGAIEKNEDIRDCVADENMWAAEELLITNVVIENNSTINAYAPRIRITGTSHIERGSRFRAGVPVFKVHFVNMVDPNSAKHPNNVIPGAGIDFTEKPPIFMTQSEFEEFCQNEIEILNYYFKSDDGKQLVKFAMKDALLWDSNMLETNYYQCTSTGNDESDCPQGYSNPLDAFNAEEFQPYRDDHAINIIFFDNPYKQGSGANYNLDHNGPPKILIDYQRVDENLGHDCDSDGLIDDCGTHFSGLVLPGSHNNGIQDDDHDRMGVEPHEMGHIFGLYHTCRNHPYNPNDPDFEFWDNIMWGLPLKTTPAGYNTCCEDVVPKPTCQHWFRESFFSKEPISREDGHYKYIQSYYETTRLNYENHFSTYGQAEIIMNMAYHFKEIWSLE